MSLSLELFLSKMRNLGRCSRIRNPPELGDCARFLGIPLYKNENSVTFPSKVLPNGIPFAVPWSKLADA